MCDIIQKEKNTEKMKSDMKALFKRTLNDKAMALVKGSFFNINNLGSSYYFVEFTSFRKENRKFDFLNKMGDCEMKRELIRFINLWAQYDEIFISNKGIVSKEGKYSAEVNEKAEELADIINTLACALSGSFYYEII